MFINEKRVFVAVNWVNNVFKMINVLAIFAFEDDKQMLCRLYVEIGLNTAFGAILMGQ